MIPILLSLGGVARCGKDTFAALLVEHLTSLGQPVSTWAFADCLKRELESTIRAKYGLSVWTQDSAEKAIIRPDLVAHGEKRRAETKGRYWVDKLDTPVRAGLAAGIHQIVKDCRYATSDIDEAGWTHSLGGKVVYVERVMPNSAILGPANSTEAKHDPLLRRAADIHLSWPTLPLDQLRPYVERVWRELTQVETMS